MDKITWYHLQHGNVIRAGDEYYADHLGFGRRWYPVAKEYFGKEYDAASMQPIRRRQKTNET